MSLPESFGRQEQCRVAEQNGPHPLVEGVQPVEIALDALDEILLFLLVGDIVYHFSESMSRFDETLTEKMAEMDRKQTSATEGDGSSITKAKRRREAISRALVAQGYLKYTSRRIPSPISRPKVA
jgi:hypothetical protein